MLKGVSVRSTAFPIRSASRRHRRIVRARIGVKATAIDPRHRLVFDNVDETTLIKKRTVKRETATQPSVKREPPDWVEDWAEETEREEADWGSTPESQSPEDSQEGDYFRDEGTSYYKASSISVLTETDKENILPLIPLGDQANFYSPQEFSTKLAWWGSALCGCVLFANSATWMAALSLSVPIILPWGLAGLRNWELQSGGKTAFMGIWHCQVLASDILEAPATSKSGIFSSPGKRDGSSPQKMVRLLIGDPWNGGARTEMVVPISERDEVPNIGELCDLLVLTKSNDFRQFKAVREAFFPRTRMWLAEYPFINRDNFYRLICEIQRQQNEVIMDQDHW